MSQVQLNDSDLMNFFAMIADPVRFNILALLLKENEVSVTKIIEIVDRPQGMISYHLKCLKDCGLVKKKESESDARIKLYSLHETAVVKQVFQIAENFLMKHDECKNHPACRLNEEVG